MRTNEKKIKANNAKPLVGKVDLLRLTDDDAKFINEHKLVNVTGHELFIFMMNFDFVQITFIKRIPFVNYDEYVDLLSKVKNIGEEL